VIPQIRLATSVHAFELSSTALCLDYIQTAGSRRLSAVIASPSGANRRDLITLLGSHHGLTNSATTGLVVIDLGPALFLDPSFAAWLLRPAQ